MPPAGYPAFLQYLQSGRVRRSRREWECHRGSRSPARGTPDRCRTLGTWDARPSARPTGKAGSLEAFWDLLRASLRGRNPVHCRFDPVSHEWIQGRSDPRCASGRGYSDFPPPTLGLSLCYTGTSGISWRLNIGGSSPGHASAIGTEDSHWQGCFLTPGSPFSSGERAWPKIHRSVTLMPDRSTQRKERSCTLPMQAPAK